MKYGIFINLAKSFEWGLNVNEALLFAWYYELPSWAISISNTEEGEYYFASRFKVIEELPILTDKPDTVYRLTKNLIEKGLIVSIKYDNKDWVKLTEKGRQWYEADGLKVLINNESEASENFPSKPGNNSEKGSEKNPTYNNTIRDKNINNKGATLFESPRYSEGKMVECKNSSVYKYDDFKLFFKDEIAAGIDINYYYQSVKNWADKKGVKRKSWIAEARHFMLSDKARGKLIVLNVTDDTNAEDYLGL